MLLGVDALMLPLLWLVLCEWHPHVAASSTSSSDGVDELPTTIDRAGGSPRPQSPPAAVGASLRQTVFNVANIYIVCGRLMCRHVATFDPAALGCCCTCCQLLPPLVVHPPPS